MSSVFLRGSIYWMEYKDGSKVVRTSTKMRDKASAERVLRIKEAEVTLGIRPEAPTSQPVLTMGDAIDRWLKEHQHKRSISDDVLRGEWWKLKLGKVPLKLVTAERIRSALDEKRRVAGTSNATANRYISLIRSVLNSCEIDWQWLEKAPKIRMYQEPPGRVRYLSKEEIASLLAELPSHLKDMVTFSLATGLRQGNVKRLRWSWVDLERRTVTVPSSEFKTNKTHSIPLTDAALEVLKRQHGRNPVFVFTYQGHAITRPDGAAWKKALQRAGISDMRWHDLRHTFASHHAMNGTDFKVLQRLGGWKNGGMLDRYVHLSPHSHVMQLYQGNGPV